MRKVGSRELKNRMGKYLREVKHGRSIAITERGTRIATITPKKEQEQDETSELLATMEMRGLIRRAKGKLSKFRAVKNSGKPASQIIIEDRQ